MNLDDTLLLSGGVTTGLSAGSAGAYGVNKILESANIKKHMKTVGRLGNIEQAMLNNSIVTDEARDLLDKYKESRSFLNTSGKFKTEMANRGLRDSAYKQLRMQDRAQVTEDFLNSRIDKAIKSSVGNEDIAMHGLLSKKMGNTAAKGAKYAKRIRGLKRLSVGTGVVGAGLVGASVLSKALDKAIEKGYI